MMSASVCFEFFVDYFNAKTCDILEGNVTTRIGNDITEGDITEARMPISIDSPPTLTGAGHQ